MSGIERSNDSVKKSIMYIAIFISLMIGFLAGIIYSSIQSDSSPQIAPSQPAASMPQTNRPAGLTPQQASKVMALNQRITQNPQDATAWTELGNVFFDTGQPIKAINAYEKSIKIQPANANVLTDLGVMYRRSGQPDKAIETFNRASNVDPTNVQAKFNKGIVLLYDKGDATAAIKIWQDILKTNPGAMAGNGRSVSDFISEAQKMVK